MEYYDWQNNASRQAVLAIHNWGEEKIAENLIPNITAYSESVSKLINDGK